MRNSFSVAVFSVSLAVGIFIGCSAPSPDGTSLSRGRGSDRNTGDGDDDGSGSTTPGDTVSCESHAPVDDRPACDKCVRSNCCAQVVDCDKSSDCAAVMKCLDECAGDIACSLTCQIAHEIGSGMLAEVAGCAQTKCEAECPSQGIGDGGLDLEDAF